MKRPSIFTERRGALDVKMTPMIDVVFLLLIFFVWTASFRVAEYSLPSELSAATGTAPADPTEPPPPEADFDNVVVRIVWQDDRVSWSVNDAPIATLADLRERLSQIAAINRSAPVILFPDDDTPLGHVIDVHDLARLAEFDEVQFAAKEG